MSAAAPVPGSGVLAIWHDLDADPEMEREILEWYNREHHNERLAVPGFLRARRYAVVEGFPRIFSRYDTIDPAVLSSNEYLRRVDNPSPWTRRTMPHYRHMSRTVCRVACRYGKGEGGKLATLRIELAAERDLSSLAATITDELIPELEHAAGVIGGQLLHGIRNASGIDSNEKKLRGGADAHCELALLIGGSDLSDVWRAGESVRDRLAVDGTTVELGLYELVFDRSVLD